MRTRIGRETFGARRWQASVTVAMILGGCWTAWGLTPAGRGATLSLALAPEVKKEEPTRSVWDGVYTEEQAGRGRSLFRAQCADCHKAEEFKKGYRTVDELFSTRENMPQSLPDSLSAEEYADLIAYIFEANGLPSGKEELKGEPEILKRIRIEAEKPEGR